LGTLAARPSLSASPTFTESRLKGIDHMSAPSDLPRVTAVVLAWKAEPWFQRGVEAILASEKVTADVVIVDNGCTTDDVTILEQLPGVTVVRPGENLGFAGGCNAGAAVATGDYIALVNGDAVVEPTTLARLVEEVNQPGVWIAGGSIRLASDPRTLNSAGNPVHVLGLSWAGRFGEAEDRSHPEEVTVASGCCMVVPIDAWRRLGGFDAKYFAYHDDTELSIRAWQGGGRVHYVPDAVAVHRYEFSRNTFKYYLIERNRLMFLATLWSWRSLVLLSPALWVIELGMLVMAAKQGWLGAKLRSYGWLAKHTGYMWRRRRQIHRELAVPDKQWMAMLSTTIDPSVIPLPALVGPFNRAMAAYWRLVRRFI
jgi:GT2 family glycosyltransferase